MASGNIGQQSIIEAFDSIKRVFSQNQRNDLLNNVLQLVLFSEKAAEVRV